MLLIILCFGTLFGLGAFFLSAGLLRLPTSASTRAVMTVTSRKKESKSLDAVVMDMAFKVSKLVKLSDFKRRKLEATLKSADIQMTPEAYIAKAWVKAALVGLLIIPVLLIFPLLAPVILFLAIAIYFREMKQADEIVKVKREEIEYELPRLVGTITQELRASRDVLNILKSYQRNAGPTMKRELEITIADMASGNEETALLKSIGWSLKAARKLLDKMN